MAINPITTNTTPIIYIILFTIGSTLIALEISTNTIPNIRVIIPPSNPIIG